MNSRIHFESKLNALYEFHRRRFWYAPDGIFETILPRLQAMRAAMGLQASALPILLMLAEKHGHTEAFRVFVQARQLPAQHKPFVEVKQRSSAGGPATK